MTHPSPCEIDDHSYRALSIIEAMGAKPAEGGPKPYRFETQFGPLWIGIGELMIEAVFEDVSALPPPAVAGKAADPRSGLWRWLGGADELDAFEAALYQLLPPASGLCGADHIKRMMKMLEVVLSDEQAFALWLECREILLSKCRYCLLREIETTQGSLDTYPREVLMDALGWVMTGQGWPCNGDGADVLSAFLDAFRAEVARRSYPSAWQSTSKQI